MATSHPGQIVHVEYTSSDLAATRAFFEKAFGWKFTQQPMPPGMEYWTFEAAGGSRGGLMGPMPNQPVGTTMTYVQVASVDASVAKATKDGATVCLPKTEIPHVGWFSIVEAPGGVQFAFFERMPPEQGGHSHPH